MGYLQAIEPLNDPAMNITFNELRDIKDSLPDGSIHQIAKELDLNVETVWNYFGGYTHPEGKPMGVHVEGGADGGVVRLDDTRILDIAKRMIGEQQPQRV
jgi:molybdenum-dependent DNA-binding transcriptional regulator ModE